MTSRLFRTALAAFLLAASNAMAQAMPWVPGEPALAPKALPAPHLRLSPDTVAAKSLRVQSQLSPITDSELEAVRDANRRAASPGAAAKRLVIGVNRASDGAGPLPAAADLRWVAVDGGRAAQAAVTSPQAASLRLAIALAGVPANVEMVFFGSSAPDRLLGPIRVGDIADRTTAWWSPLTEGETQTVEFFVPNAPDAAAPPIRITGASHLFAGPSSQFQKRVQDIGDAGACNVDIPCSGLNSNAAFRNATEAVAQMVFTDGSFTALCTGTLLNDSDPSTQIPWFYSANHCFENESPPLRTPAQIQAIASSLNTLWHFEASSCRSTTPSPSYSQLATGATYIYNNAQADALFLRLNSAPPAGAFFAGWDSNPISAGTGVVTIHHPQGDLKKVSEGSVLGFSTPPVIVSGGSFIQVRWSLGTTEGGSSGAGLFTPGNSQYLLRGGLWGGSALCSNPSGTDNYSRFDLVYPALAQYLSASSSNIDYTDLWWNPGESGWGLNLIQHASRNIFGVWYTYALDGKRMWYVMPGGAWIATNVFRSDIYATSGPPPTGPFDAGRVASRIVGTGTLSFSDANNATFAYSINGISGTKAITRQPF
jgi:lysyl endopeptidase